MEESVSSPLATLLLDEGRPRTSWTQGVVLDVVRIVALATSCSRTMIYTHIITRWSKPHATWWSSSPPVCRVVSHLLRKQRSPVKTSLTGTTATVGHRTSPCDTWQEVPSALCGPVRAAHHLSDHVCSGFLGGVAPVVLKAVHRLYPS
jgi:hypothetical protein